jgi:hypothetical protein
MLFHIPTRCKRKLSTDATARALSRAMENMADPAKWRVFADVAMPGFQLKETKDGLEATIVSRKRTFVFELKVIYSTTYFRGRVTIVDYEAH